MGTAKCSFTQRTALTRLSALPHIKDGILHKEWNISTKWSHNGTPVSLCLTSGLLKSTRKNWRFLMLLLNVSADMSCKWWSTPLSAGILGFAINLVQPWHSYPAASTSVTKTKTLFCALHAQELLQKGWEIYLWTSLISRSSIYLLQKIYKLVIFILTCYNNNTKQKMTSWFKLSNS